MLSSTFTMQLKGGTRYKIRWVERDHADEGTDMHALMNGYISIGVVNNIS